MEPSHRILYSRTIEEFLAAPKDDQSEGNIFPGLSKIRERMEDDFKKFLQNKSTWDTDSWNQMLIILIFAHDVLHQDMGGFYKHFSQYCTARGHLYVSFEREWRNITWRHEEWDKFEVPETVRSAIRLRLSQTGACIIEEKLRDFHQGIEKRDGLLLKATLTHDLFHDYILHKAGRDAQKLYPKLPEYDPDNELIAKKYRKFYESLDPFYSGCELRKPIIGVDKV